MFASGPDNGIDIAGKQGAGMRQFWQGRSYSFARWAAAAVGVTVALMIGLAFVIQPLRSVEDFPNPLSPPDTESPRATLEAFHRDLAAAERLITDTYKVHIEEPGWFMSPETRAKEARIRAISTGRCDASISRTCRRPIAPRPAWKPRCWWRKSSTA